MKKRMVICFLLFSSILLIYQFLVFYWPGVDKAIDNYVEDKHHPNYDYDEKLPSDVTLFKDRRYGGTTVMGTLKNRRYGTTVTGTLKRFFDHFFPSSSSSLPYSSSSSSSHDENVKVILFWNSWFKKPWWVRFDKKAMDLVKSGCPETRCLFTHDKSKLQIASALLFQSQRIKSDNLPSYRSPKQRWVWVHVEPPTTSLEALVPLSPVKGLSLGLSHLFNWTMTYHEDSDIMEPYGGLVPYLRTNDQYVNLELMSNSTITSHSHSIKPLTKTFPHFLSSLRPAMLDTSTEIFQKYLQLLHRSPSVDELMGSNWLPNLEWDKGGTYSWHFLANRRPRLIAWVSSHCPTFSEREEYVSQLQNYVKVDAYGTCGTYRCGSRESHRDDRCWKQILARKYLFYLSFENSMCDGYITEKLWRPLFYGLVPIVMGGANYTKFLPPKSFINALEYSPKELGQLLKDLQESPDYYIQFHLWRVFWKVTLRPPLCEICLKLHNDTKHSVKHDIAKWWINVGNCTNPAQWPKKPS